MICDYHWRRAKEEVPAKHVVKGEAFCENCFKGFQIGQTKKRRRLDGKYETECESPITPGN